MSIGLPVFNGERYLGKAIESILAQTYGDFELIVSDNASTDGTAAICARFAALDHRVRIAHSASNRGAAANFNQTVQMAQGRYFKWAAHDDLLRETYLARTVAVLEGAPDAIAAHSRVAFIDEDDGLIRDDPFPLRNAAAPRPSQRFANAILTPHWCFWAFSLIRTELLLKTDLIGAYTSSDRVLIAHLALLGCLVEVPETLFLTREHPERALSKIPQRLRFGRVLRAVGPLPAAEWYDPARAGRIVFPQWNLWRRYVDIVRRSGLERSERAGCEAALVRWLGCNRNAVKLLRDVVLAGEQILLRASERVRSPSAAAAGEKRSAP